MKFAGTCIAATIEAESPQRGGTTSEDLQRKSAAADAQIIQDFVRN